MPGQRCRVSSQGVAGVFLRVGGIGFVILLAIWLYCLLDAITSDESRVRNLPKMAWILIVLLLLDVGAILWLIAGRPRGTAAGAPYRVDRGNRRGPTAPPTRRPSPAPDDDPEFLAELSRRQEEEHRRKLGRWEAELQRREEELRRREQDGGGTGPEDSR
jgi:hypothetical protein